MDYSLKEILVKVQEDDVPFIGDLMNPDELETFEIKHKTIEATSLTFHGEKFHGEVVLTADYSEAPDGYDYVIVGVRLLIKPDRNNIKQEISAVWTVAGFTKVRQVEIGFDVTPAPTVVATLLLMTLEDFSDISMTSVSLMHNYAAFRMISGAFENASKIESELANVIVENDLNSLRQFKNFMRKLPAEVQSSIVQNVSQLRADNWVYATHYIVKKIIWAVQKVNMGDTFLHDLGSRYNKQKEIIDFAINHNFKYINDEKAFQHYLRSFPELYVLYMNHKDFASNQEAVDVFLRMKNSLPDVNFCVVNLDIVKFNGAGVKPFVIQKFVNGICDLVNVMYDMKKNKQNVAKCKGKRQNITPRSRAALNIPCPGFYSANCPGVSFKWICHDCQGQLYYGFDKNLYCYCGGADIDQFTFRCERDSHGGNFLPLTNRSALNALERLETINIIVLGQSGVGKSTWINAFVNYMTFSSLEDAKKSDFLVPIPVKFTVTQRGSFKPVEVVCGNHEDNENLNIGESATQNCKDYNIVFEDKVYNIIDTPGLGDTRGIEEDKKNVKKILDHLSQVDVIHGICLILKPNESRITVLLKYCLKEILSNLHKSSSNNLLFCFTHARSTFYRAGETLPILRQLLTEIDVGVSCLDNSFHMDNEAFRFLCCQSANVKFSQEEEVTFSESWNRSVSETKRLLDTVSMMVPHQTTEILSLNRSRNIILNLIPFMVEITENIERNLRQMENHQRDVANHKGSLNELKDLRFCTQIDLEREDLDHPRTVCAAENCVQYIFLPKSGERKAKYVAHCHPHCYLSGRMPDVRRNPELMQCAAMNGTKNCIVCFCSWEDHMHIFYEQKLVEKMVEDKDVARRINEYKNSSELKADLIANDKLKIDNLEGEKKTIISNCVKFACFLKDNAIVAYNDSFLDYFEWSLRQLKDAKYKTPLDKDRIVKMEETKNHYLQEKKIFSEASKSGNNSVTQEDIARGERELYDLPMHGRQLRAIMETALNNQVNAPRDPMQATTIIAERPKGYFQKVKEAATNIIFGKGQHQNSHRKNYRKAKGRGQRY